MIFEEIDEKKYNERVNKAAEYLAKDIEAKDIVASVIKDISIDELEALEKRIKKNAKVKKKKGCFNLVIDGMEILIVE